MYLHMALAIDLKHAIQYSGEVRVCDETKGEMIKISTLPGSVTRLMHLHHNAWPLLVTFPSNVNKLVFCLLESALDFCFVIF